MLADNQSCALCAGKGCITKLFGAQRNAGQPLPAKVSTWLYGLPLICMLTGALAGAYHSETMSIGGAGLGLLGAYVVLRACQRRLNRLSLCTGLGSGSI